MASEIISFPKCRSIRRLPRLAVDSAEKGEFIAIGDSLIERAQRSVGEPIDSEEDIFFLARAALAFLVLGQTTRAKNSLALVLASMERTKGLHRGGGAIANRRAR